MMSGHCPHLFKGKLFALKEHYGDTDEEYSKLMERLALADRHIDFVYE